MRIFVPGRAMKASAWRAISAFLWCMSDTALTSPIVSPVICLQNTYQKLFLGTKTFIILIFYSFFSKNMLSLQNLRIMFLNLKPNYISFMKEFKTLYMLNKLLSLKEKKGELLFAPFTFNGVTQLVLTF